jgi:lipopolysaccharide export system permease protein
VRWIINRYIAREILPIFFTGLLVAVFVIIATRTLSLTEMVVSRGARVSDMAWLLAFLLPEVLAFALPAAVLMAVATAFLRLSADSEIIALKSSGVSLYQMLPPVVVFSAGGFFLSLVIALVAVPWGNSSFKDLVFRIAQSQASLGIQERVFSEPFDNIVFYVNDFSRKDGTMRDVFVDDRREGDMAHSVIAKKAFLVSHAEKKLINVHFQNGTIFMVDKNGGSARSIHFDTYDIHIQLDDLISALDSREKSPKEMNVGELIDELRAEPRGSAMYNAVMVKLMEKFSISAAVLIMGIIGVPLGAHLKARGRSAGIGVSLFVFMVYYLFLAGARSVGEAGVVPPAVGVWVPVVFLAACCTVFLRRAARELPLLPFTIRSLFDRGLRDRE